MTEELDAATRGKLEAIAHEFIEKWNNSLLDLEVEHSATRNFAAFMGVAIASENDFGPTEIDSVQLAFEALRAIHDLESRVIALEKRHI